MSLTLYIDPAQPPGARVSVIEDVPRGVLRPGMIGGLPVMALAMDGQNGPAWGIGRTVLAGRYIIALPGCDDDPAKRAGRYVHAMRFPAGADAARLGELVRQTIAATGHGSAASLEVAATKHAAEIAAIIARTQPEPGTAV